MALSAGYYTGQRTVVASEPRGGETMVAVESAPAPPEADAGDQAASPASTGPTVRQESETTMLMLLPALLLAGQSASVQHARPSEPVVQVGLFSYHADGTAAGSAFGTADRLESTVFASGSLCQLGAGYSDLPAMAAHAWKFTGRVISANAESAVVQLEWQRIMSQGATVTEAPTSVQLTLKAGDRVLLDSVAPQTARGCSVTNAGFEARYMTRFAGLNHQFTAAAKVEAQVGESRSWRRSGRRGVGAGAGGGTGAGAARRERRQEAGGVRWGRRTVYGSECHRRRPDMDPESLKVELWLVRSVPGMEDQTVYQTLTLHAGRGDVRVRARVRGDTRRDRPRTGNRLLRDPRRPSRRSS